MEKKSSKKIGILAVVFVLVVGLLVCLLMMDQKRKNREKEAMESLQMASLDASEDTPQVVLDKIDAESSEASQNSETTGESLNFEESVEVETSESAPEETSEAEASEESSEMSTEVVASGETVNTQETQSVQAQTQQSVPVETKVQDITPVVTADGKTIDFATLQSKKNAHIYAWITVPGTNIDYPVLRHPTDDGFYLYHNLDGSSGYPGCIYTENWNSKDWTDPVTVLYGHDMRSTGTMFHQLHKFEKQDFFDKNQYIYIYTPEQTLTYRIFATYVHSNEHLLYNHNFSDKDEFQSFFDTVMRSAGGVNHVRDDMEISAGSKVITLSTCIKNKPNNRYLVFGVLQ